MLIYSKSAVGVWKSNRKRNVGWASKDPAGFKDGLNLYSAYFDVNGVDALGLDSGIEFMFRTMFGVGGMWNNVPATISKSARAEGAAFAKTVSNAVDGDQIMNRIGDVINLPCYLLVGDKGQPYFVKPKLFTVNGRQVEVLFVNGVYNDQSGVLTSAKAFETVLQQEVRNDSLGVGVVHNKTGLFNLKNGTIGSFANGCFGMAYDLVQVVTQQLGMTDDTSSFVADVINKELAGNNRIFFLVAHSQGGAVINQSWENVDLGVRSRVYVITAAGAQVGGFGGAGSVTLVNKKGDPVVYLGNGRLDAKLYRHITGVDVVEREILIPTGDIFAPSYHPFIGNYERAVARVIDSIIHDRRP